MGLEDQVIDEMTRKKSAKILSFDIETSPIVAYTWGPKWETSLIEFIDHSQILSYSAKWLDGKQVTRGQDDTRGYKPGKLNDKQLVKELHDLFSEADILVAHNGKQFDIKTVNARFLAYDLPPPEPYKVVDTKTEAKKVLRLPSNKLDDIGAYFGLGRKMVHTGFELWKGCMAGDPKSWNDMKKYNAQDVVLLEKIYTKLRGFMTNHPNQGSYVQGECCPNCSSDELQKRGTARTLTGLYQRYQCKPCGSWSRGPYLEANWKINRSVK